MYPYLLVSNISTCQTPKTLLNRSIGAIERESNTREIGMVGMPYEVKETNTPN